MENIMITDTTDIGQIKQAWQQVQEQHPGMRIREAARKLGLSEGQLLATQVGQEAKRLLPNWSALLKRLPELGRVMSLTRNDACVLEHKGAFEKVSVFGEGDHHMAVVLGPIETRVFLKSWHAGFAVHTTKGDRDLISLQIFDHEGTAVTKIFLQSESDRAAYDKLVEDFTDPVQDAVLTTEAYDPVSYTANVDTDAFLTDWAQLKDTHDFFPMLRKHGVHRYHAVELAEGRFSHRIATSSIEAMLEIASREKLPIMVFAGNRGNLQIHQDTVRTIRMLERGHNGAEKWLNVLDPHFNMHLRIDLVTDVWVVVKPTTDGDVTALECYDANHEMVVQFFGLRKPGQNELTEWRSLVDDLPKL
ncbi:MAG: ChuX/HutX family heme-like substrate-binding protein [Bacteroidota bacterium]